MARPRSVSRTEWRPFFDDVSRALIGKRAEVESASLELGDQVVAEWLPLMGITYDSQDDLVHVSLQGREHLTHLIRHPQDIVIFEGPTGIESVALTSRDGAQETIRFREPLMLPASAAGA